MAHLTKIEWCDASLNLWWGCTKVSDGCKFCYAEHIADHRHKKGNWGPGGTRKEVKSWRNTLAKISKQAKAENRRLKVFCQSMSDTFEGHETMGGRESENWTTVRLLRWDLLSAILNHPELDFLLLTKRPENIITQLIEADRCDARLKGIATAPLPDNLWIGTSVEDQKTADERIPHLLQIPAAVRFLSCEPLLGPVHFSREAWVCKECGIQLHDLEEDEDDVQSKLPCPECGSNRYAMDFPSDRATLGGEYCGIHWVIAGGESGPNARPMHPDWARALRDQCQAAGVPFFFKQGSQSNWQTFKDFSSFPKELQIREFPNA